MNITQWLPLAVLAGPCASVHARQAPFTLNELLSDESTPIQQPPHLQSDVDSSWNLLAAERPSANTSHNLVFDSVASLLQRWPNTRYRNGHNVVPGTIPAGTLLYHGSHFPNPPQGPEWVALDPEHSYLFTGFCFPADLADPSDLSIPQRAVNNNSSWPNSESCWHLTFTTTRPLRVLYFDGSSAAKLPLLLRNRKPKENETRSGEAEFPVMEKAGGTLDSQDFLLWGRVREDMITRDDERIQEMCGKWGRGGSEVEDGGGFDGFVRMQMSFEVMLCDFNAGTRLVTSLPLPSFDFPVDTEDPPPSPVMTSLIQAGSWHNSFPGETRINLDLSRLLSFYDTKLIPSLVHLRVNQARWGHRIRGISEEDVSRAREALRNISTPRLTTSNVYWKGLFHTVMDRYAERLETIRDLLDVDSHGSTSMSRNDLKLAAQKVQTILRFILTPYITTSVTPASSAGKSLNSTWASLVFRLCSTAFTEYLFSADVELTSSEVLMRESIFHTNKEICRVTTKMWARGVEIGLDSALFSSQQTKSAVSLPEIEKLLRDWKDEVESLMRWLDWSVWVKCRPACGSEEMCYLPTWPLLDPIPVHTPTTKAVQDSDDRAKNGQHEGDPEVDWLDPQPRCVRKIMPYEL